MTEQPTFDFRSPWRALVRGRRWLALCALAGLAGGTVLSKPTPVTYMARQRLAIGALPGDTVVGPLERELIADADAVESVEARLGATPDQLEATALPVGPFLDLAVTSGSEALAVKTLAAYAESYLDRRRTELAARKKDRVEQAEGAIEQSQARLDAVTAVLDSSLSTAERTALQRERDTLQDALTAGRGTLAELQAFDPREGAGRLVGSKPTVRERGGAGAVGSDAAAGLLGGLSVGGGLVLVVEKLRARVRGSRDVRRVSPDLPVLAAVAAGDAGRSDGAVWSIVSARLPREGGAVVVAPAGPVAEPVSVAEGLARAASAAGEHVELVAARKVLRPRLPELPRYLLVDAPPLLARPMALDAVRYLGPERASVLLVLEAGRTSHREQRMAVEVLAAAGVPVLGAVLVEAERSEAFPLVPPRRGWRADADENPGRSAQQQRP